MYYFHHFEAGDFEHSGSKIEFDSYDNAKKALIEMVTLTKTISIDDIENWTIKNTENDDDNGYIDVSDINKELIRDVDKARAKVEEEQEKVGITEADLYTDKEFDFVPLDKAKANLKKAHDRYMREYNHTPEIQIEE